MVLFYTPNNEYDPGIYGWVVVTMLDEEELSFRTSSPSDYMKMNPVWDDEVKYIIINGAGGKSFSSGADIKEMTNNAKWEPDKVWSDWYWRIAACKKPTIGAINGLAYGGGAMLSSLLDIRIGCEQTRFRFLMVEHGAIGVTWSLPFIVGWSSAKDLLMTGRTVEGEEALRIGLLNKLVPCQNVMPTALEFARDIASNDAPAVQATKRILNENIGMSWRESMLHEAKAKLKLKMKPPEENFKEFLRNRE
jgi:enoyl-CoA hydratase/carnithine racemase